MPILLVGIGFYISVKSKTKTLNQNGFMKKKILRNIYENINCI